MTSILTGLAAAAALAVATTAAVAARADDADIVDTAVAAGQFTTLAAALDAAGLVETLKGPGPFTVFAPTDEAFAKLPAGTVESLLQPENKDTKPGGGDGLVYVMSLLCGTNLDRDDPRGRRARPGARHPARSG